VLRLEVMVDRSDCWREVGLDCRLFKVGHNLGTVPVDCKFKSKSFKLRVVRLGYSDRRLLSINAEISVDRYRLGTHGVLIFAATVDKIVYL